jgi:hypothetical protein
MVLTNFPNGVSSFGVPLLGNEAIPMTTGSYFYVSSVTGNNGGDGSYESPFATIAYACTKCTNYHDDVIVVLPYHRETVIAAGTITASVHGTTIIGIGEGVERPVITFGTATTASFLCSGNGVTVRNIVGLCGVDSISRGFHVTGDNCTLDVEWQDVDGTYEAVRAVYADTVVNFRLKLRYRGGVTLNSGINAVRLIAVTGARLDVDLYGKWSTAAVQMITTLSTDVKVAGSIYNTSSLGGAKNVVDTPGTSTWVAQVIDGLQGQMWVAGTGMSATLIGSPSVLQSTTAAVAGLILGTTALFTIQGGPIVIQNLWARCTSANNTNGSTLKFTIAATAGGAVDVSAASATLASAIVGTTLTITGTFANATAINVPPVVLAGTQAGVVHADLGVIQAIVGTAAITGTWQFGVTYRPLRQGAFCVPSF